MHAQRQPLAAVWLDPPVPSNLGGAGLYDAAAPSPLPFHPSDKV